MPTNPIKPDVNALIDDEHKQLQHTINITLLQIKALQSQLESISTYDVATLNSINQLYVKLFGLTTEEGHWILNSPYFIPNMPV